MKFETIITGADGESVASLATILSTAAIRAGVHVSQSALGAVAGRPGAAIAYVRISDCEIEEMSVPSGEADLIVALEPLEALRQREHLSPSGALISAAMPVKNLAEYPPVEDLLWSILSMRRGFLIDAAGIAGMSDAAAMAHVVLAGAATDFMPMDAQALRASVAEVFEREGEAAVAKALAAYEAGRTSLHHREIVDEFETFATIRH